MLLVLTSPAILRSQLLPSFSSLIQPKCQVPVFRHATCLSTSTLRRKMSRIWPFLFVANPHCARAAPSLDGTSINRAPSRRSWGNNTNMHHPPPPDETCNCTFSKPFAKSMAMVAGAGSSSRALWRKPSISNVTSHKVRSSPSACVEAAFAVESFRVFEFPENGRSQPLPQPDVATSSLESQKNRLWSTTRPLELFQYMFKTVRTT